MMQRSAHLFLSFKLPGAEGIEWLRHESDQRYGRNSDLSGRKSREQGELEHDIALVVTERDVLKQLLRAFGGLVKQYLHLPASRFLALGQVTPPLRAFEELE